LVTRGQTLACNWLSVNMDAVYYIVESRGNWE
jgi:hypothetical protein